MYRCNVTKTRTNISANITIWKQGPYFLLVQCDELSKLSHRYFLDVHERFAVSSLQAHQWLQLTYNLMHYLAYVCIYIFSELK